MWPYKSGKAPHAILANSRQTLLDADLALVSAFVTQAVDTHLIGDEVKLTPEDERRFIWLLVSAIRMGKLDEKVAAVLYGAGGQHVRHRAFQGRSKFLHGKSGIRAGAR
jgi:hypothetical protein